MFAATAEFLFKCFGYRFTRTPPRGCDEDEVTAQQTFRFIWSKDLEKHYKGEFSFASVQANLVTEDQGRVEAGADATFIGVFDGHGGPHASGYASRHLYTHLLRLAKESGSISQDTLNGAFAETESGFLGVVTRLRRSLPAILAVGSCCLVGVFWGTTLYVANLGDCRAVLGRLDASSGNIVAEQLTSDHNCRREEIRNELRQRHPNDPEIVKKIHGTWRLKGIIQVSRAVGDAYLKSREFNAHMLFPRNYFRNPIRSPAMRADPEITTRNLEENDRFVIFASDGLWDAMTNEEAVELVHSNPRQGIAKRLVDRAVEARGRAHQMSRVQIGRVSIHHRRRFHDDITVVVVFIDGGAPAGAAPAPQVSVRSFVDAVEISSFNFARREEAGQPQYQSLAGILQPVPKITKDAVTGECSSSSAPLPQHTTQ